MATARYKQDIGRVTLFLRDNLGLYYCDDCVYEETRAGSSAQANRIRRMLLATSNTYDEGTECDICGKTRKTIAFLPRIYLFGTCRA